MCGLPLSWVVPCPLPLPCPLSEPGLLLELPVPELEGLVGVGLVFVLMLLPKPFPLLAVFALRGAWKRNGTDAAIRLDAIMAIAPTSRLSAGKFIGFSYLPFLFSAVHHLT